METRNFINGYYLIEQDLKETITFIEPTKANFSTYSHRLYTLLIRACMEFEANCRDILLENNYQSNKSEDNYNMKDYIHIHDYNYQTINDYAVRLHLSEPIVLQPLFGWNDDKPTQSLPWYQAYNSTKHSRVKSFQDANLKNVLNAASAVYILLYARFGDLALCRYQRTEAFHIDDDFICKEDSLFQIKTPT